MNSANLLKITIFWSLAGLTTAQEEKKVYSVLEFCHNGKLYAFSSKVCPGGVRFIHEPVHPVNDCFCTSGTFITVGAEFGADYSIIAGNEKCLAFNGNNNVAINNASTSNYSCAENSELARWHIIPLTDVGAPTEDWVAFWSDPSKLGEFKNLRKFPLSKFSNKMLFGNGNSYSGNVAIIKSNGSDLTQVQIGEHCFMADNSGGQIFIFKGMTLKKTESDTAVKTCTAGDDKKVYPVQVMSTGEDTELFCDLSTDCVEHYDTYAFYSDYDPPKSDWSRMSEVERKDLLHDENIHLVEYRMRMEHQGAKVVIPYYSHRIEIVNMTKRILQKAAADVIPSSLIETAFRLFHYLYFDVDTESELQDVQYNKIMYTLEQCLYNMEPMNFGKSGCPATVDSFSSMSAKGVTLSYDKTELPADRKFDPEKNDAIVELMWKAVDFAHAQCFGQFEFHSNLHHYFETQMEKLFLMEEVQYRWNRNIPAGMKLYGPILPKLDSTTMENLDFIVGSSHLNSVYDNWLKKPVLDLAKAQEDAKNKPPVQTNLNGYKIWGGLAYCLQYNENMKKSRKGQPGQGIRPSLAEIKEILNNGPTKCPVEKT